MGTLKDELIKLYGGTTEEDDVVAEYQNEIKNMAQIAKRGRSVKMRKAVEIKEGAGGVLQFHKNEPLSHTIYKLIAHKRGIDAEDIIEARKNINSSCNMHSVMIYVGHLKTLGLVKINSGVISVTEKGDRMTADELRQRVDARYGRAGKPLRRFTRKSSTGEAKRLEVKVAQVERIPVPTTLPKSRILEVPIESCVRCTCVYMGILTGEMRASDRCFRTLKPIAETGIREDCPLRG